MSSSFAPSNPGNTCLTRAALASTPSVASIRTATSIQTNAHGASSAKIAWRLRKPANTPDAV